ncbi:MAG: hypothetical protein KDH88_00020 [Chromatiales bacterium]|nr:hypothetical protein [Chromatiales bacterium]
MKSLHRIYISALVCAATATSAVARDPDVITRKFLDPSGKRVGTLWIMNIADGPDIANMKFERLPPNKVLTVHLAESAQMGSVPTVYVGHFQTDENGDGQFDLQMELYNTYITANQGLENDSGIGRTEEIGIPPGDTANGGKAVPLIHFRIYSGTSSAGGVRSVFGLSPNLVGGGHIASTDKAFGCCYEVGN